jgi:dihydroorotase
MANQVGGLNIDDNEALHEAFAKAAAARVPVAVHAEDHATILAEEHAQKAAKNDGPKAFLKAHSEEAELKAIERVLNASAGTEMHVHFCHVSTKKGLNRIVEAKKMKRKVSCEVTPNHLLLSRTDFELRSGLLAIMPPLRGNADIEALWQGVTDGSVDVLGSDHAPHTLEEKLASSIWEAKVGVPGLETTLPLMLTMVKKNRLTIDTLVRLLAEEPAEIFSLKGRGNLEQGGKADLVAVDLKARFRIDASKFHSKAKFSPFDGWEALGRPVKTFVKGQLVMDDQEIVAKPGSGTVIRRET